MQKCEITRISWWDKWVSKHVFAYTHRRETVNANEWIKPQTERLNKKIKTVALAWQTWKILFKKNNQCTRSVHFVFRLVLGSSAQLSSRWRSTWKQVVFSYSTVTSKLIHRVLKNLLPAWPITWLYTHTHTGSFIHFLFLSSFRLLQLCNTFTLIVCTKVAFPVVKYY